MSSFVTAGGDIGNGELLAQNAQKTANDAKNLAGTADNNIKNINDPNYLSPVEKPQLQVQMDNFASIYAADKDIATAEGIGFTAYESAYQAYLAYMTPLIADMTTYSPIVRATFNSMVTAVQAEQKRFNAATQAQYNQQIKKAQTDIDDGQTKYKALQSEAKIMESSVAGISDAADRAISSAGFASNAASTASQAASSAVASAMSAESSASSAVSTANSTASAFGPVKQSADSALITASSAVSIANSTASGFGKVSQKADSAFSNAMSAESSASSAVSQALSAAADSKDAKQIAGAVSQSYKTLTDGSTMTIAELQSGLAVKLTKTDLNGYATETWSQNQIKLTADGINGTISSVKNTVDSQTTSINDLKADSNGFRDQFTTVTNTLGTQTTDISTLQASSKELVSNFDSLSTDNSTNKTNISKLSQTVEGIQTDISKKIEQKDLNGYATETWTNGQIKLTADGINGTLSKKIEKTDLNGYATQDWAQNQIKLTADGINGTMSSIKGTVDGQITSINDLQADSRGFKTQFTTVNDTIGKHTTDIGSLQVSSKELTTGFNTLTTDNGTNKHDISDLQQSAKDFSSTLETVQTQVQNSAVGTNLLTDTGDHTVTGSAANGLLSNETADSLLTLFKGLEGQTVTVSVDYEYSGFVSSGSGFNRLGWEIQFVAGSTSYTPDGAWYNPNNDSGAGRVSTTFVVPKNITSLCEYSGYIEFPGGGTGTVSHLKLEKGSLATDWCANPADNATVTAVSSISQTVSGLQSTVSDKVSSDQLTQLSNQLTNKISDLSSSTSSQFTQTSKDINGLVKKGDVVNQFNLDAGGALLSTSGDSTKIVFSSPNIIFDSANPVQIPNVNIPGTLTGKTIEASKITGDTKIKGSDIEAPLIHSPSGSFKLDGNTGDIVGASIHSADNSWGIDKNGNISGVDIKIGGTYSYVGTGSGQVNTGAIYNELDSTGYHQWTSENDHVRINNGVITITNDADEKANKTIEGIPLGVFISEGNTQFTGSLKIGNIYTNGVHTINSIDGGGIFFEDGMGAGNSMVDIHTGNINATGTIQTGNIAIGNSHSITMKDGAKAGTMYFNDSRGSQSYALKAKSFSQSSLLSLKTDITAIDPHDALTELIKNDFMSYHYKTDNTNDPKTVSVILDDINPIPEYYTSDIFKSADGTGRNDGNVVGYLALSVKDLNNREIADKAKIAELENRLQKLEGVA